MDPRTRNLARLLDVMARLRDPEGGCPWDLKQDFASIAPYTVEEAYEVSDAIERGDFDELREELGDLLLQVVYHARMAEETGLFGFDEVASAIVAKMVRRHPHVFGEEAAVAAGADPETVREGWETVKARERHAKANGEASVLDGVARALPALLRAEKLQRRAARIGFDWPEARPVFAKVEEELEETREALRSGLGPDAIEEEVGDLLFAVANLARHLKIDPEVALKKANYKFESRFRAIERKFREDDRDPAEAGLEALEDAWQAVKRDGA